MSILTWIEEKKRLKLLNAPKYVNPASDQPDLLNDGATRGGRSSKGLWTRCDKCGVILYIKHLKENQRVCFGCTYHLQMSSQERIENLLDKESWRPFDETVSPCDPLEFHDQRNYTDRLRDAQDKTGLQDAIQTGTGFIDGIPVALGIMDFDFMGGSMGSVVGEKITRLIEYATQEGLTLLLVCASGGARMQEGVFSLMQMAKISSALQIYQSCANLLYISILTSPTTGGVTASFAMLGDIIFAEPKALIAFAGRRVIEQTLCEDLPEDFQTSEYMLHHGLVDLIVPRRFLRQALSESIRLYKNAPFKKPGRIPFGVQNPISFLTEEKLRRQCRTELNPGLTRPSQLTESSDLISQTEFRLPPHGLSPLRGQPELRSGYQSSIGSAKLLLSEAEHGSAEGGPRASRAELLLSPEGAKHGREAPRVKPTPTIASEESGIAASSSAFTDQGSSSQEAGATFRLPADSRAELSISFAEHARARYSSQPATLSRQSVEYREILTSFQMMYQLFSKQMSNGWVTKSPKRQQPVLGLPTTEQSSLVAKLPKISFASMFSSAEQDPSLLRKFRELAEGVTDLVLQEKSISPEAASSNNTVSTLFPKVSRSDNNLVAERGALAPLKAAEGDTLVSKKPKELSTQPGTEFRLPPSALTRPSDECAELLLSETEHGSAFGGPRANRLLGPSDLSSYANSGETQFGLQSKPNGRRPVRSSEPQESAAGAYSAKLSNRPRLSNNRDFLNQALELAATESVEWRAFYVHQTISKTTGFLEEFLSPDQDTELLGSIDKVSAATMQLQNTLFYKSICRTIID